MTPMRSLATVLVLTVAFGVAGLYFAPNMSQAIGGQKFGPFIPVIIDGDTLSDGENRFRLVGVDACEMGQPITFDGYEQPLDCGFFAKSFVERFIQDYHVICHDQGSRSYGRIVARCFVNAGQDYTSIDNDIGAFAVMSGWATVTDHATGLFAARYIYEETLAQVSGRGAWRGAIVQQE
ncbi:thermonuclease family protein [Roseobacter weihaiensis]|uniref:thermonuclease family protein n=1 Tax=Roseobacter weihaiensis TaxID=2763262 RepID=UPI001D0AB6E8|nr:thermonuclease family protein [Roseobacter sp. H9]